MRELALLAVLLVLPALALAACGDCTPPESEAVGWSTVQEDALTPAQKTQRKSVFAARDAMFSHLSTLLMGTISESGPAKAVEVCRAAAPGAATEVGAAHGVTIGRTAQRLRNQANGAPAWAADLVAAQAADNAYLAHEDGRLAALLPIRLQNACLTCHGDPATIAPDVKQALALHYPDDRATGFRAGDLRGWFWVVAPAPADQAGDAPAR